MEEVPTQAHLAIDVDVGGLSSSSPYDADAANALAFDGCALFCATHHCLVRIARSISVLRWAPPPLMRMCQPHPPLGCISRLMRMCQPHPPLVRVSRSMGVCEPPPRVRWRFAAASSSRSRVAFDGGVPAASSSRSHVAFDE